MPRHSTTEMLDKLADGVAAGATWKDAAIAAGWAPTSKSYYRFAADPAFQRRIERSRRRREWGGIGDLGDMIGSLLRTSQATQGDTAGRNLSRLCLVSAAQLFVKMTETPHGAGDFGQPEGNLKATRGQPEDNLKTTRGQLADNSGQPEDPVVSEAEELRRALDEWAARVGVE